MIRAVGALASLTILTMTISESIFWGQPDQAYGDPLGVLPTLIAYGVAVVAVLGVLERTAPSTWLGVFLGGALLGWTVEGIVVATTYEALPFSISFTGLAWHALISVAWAWVLLPRGLTWGRRGLVRVVVVGALWDCGEPGRPPPPGSRRASLASPGTRRLPGSRSLPASSDGCTGDRRSWSDGPPWSARSR